MMAERDPFEVLTRTDLRKILRAGEDVFHTMEKGGRILRPSFHVGSQPRWLWSDVRDWLAEGGPGNGGHEKEVPISPDPNRKHPKHPDG